jgi:hypothetical protein
MKYCPKCNKNKDETDFFKCKTYKDGLYYICKECAMPAKMRYKQSERGKEVEKNYRQSQKGKSTQKKVRQKRQENGAESLRSKKRYQDENYRTSMLYTNRLYKALNIPPTKPDKCNWYQSLLKVLGCSIEHLKRHLEQQFQEEMNWDNYGGKEGWQIDHIIPRSYFNLIDETQLYICFNYRNLQPLWAKENSGIKNAKVPENAKEFINQIKKNL